MSQRTGLDLIKPIVLDVEEETLTSNYGKFIIKPLEKGLGVTIGNSLRRVLLTYLPGNAITAVKIHGLVHEFTTLPHMKEDIVEFLLNLKEVRFRFYGQQEATIRLEQEGPKTVLASDIIVPETLEVLNKEYVIATLGKQGELKAEMQVSQGRGYQSVEINKKNLLPGWMPVDSIFSPILKVNFVVNSCRVGQRTDFEELILEVFSDGSILPEKAIDLASEILIGHFSSFLNAKKKPEPIIQTQDTVGTQVNPHLYRPISDLDLSVRSTNCLQNADIKYIYELVQKTELEMLRTKNFGKRSLDELKRLLGEMSLRFDMKLEGFTPPSQSHQSVPDDSHFAEYAAVNHENEESQMEQVDEYDPTEKIEDQEDEEIL